MPPDLGNNFVPDQSVLNFLCMVSENIRRLSIQRYNIRFHLSLVPPCVALHSQGV